MSAFSGVPDSVRNRPATASSCEMRQEDALVHWSGTRGLKARPLAIAGYGEEDEADGVVARPPANGGATER